MGQVAVMAVQTVARATVVAVGVPVAWVVRVAVGKVGLVGVAVVLKEVVERVGRAVDSLAAMVELTAELLAGVSEPAALAVIEVAPAEVEMVVG